MLKQVLANKFFVYTLFKSFRIPKQNILVNRFITVVCTVWMWGAALHSAPHLTPHAELLGQRGYSVSFLCLASPRRISIWRCLWPSEITLARRILILLELWAQRRFQQSEQVKLLISNVNDFNTINISSHLKSLAFISFIHSNAVRISYMRSPS